MALLGRDGPAASRSRAVLEPHLGISFLSHRLRERVAAARSEWALSNPQLWNGATEAPAFVAKRSRNLV